MSETFERDYFLNPEAALEEGFEIKREMYKVQDLFDRAAGIERKLIALTETIPAEVRCNELIESCETSIRDIEKSDFAEYGERIERNIKTLEMESTQSVNKLKESLASCNDKLDQVISIAEELSDEIQYEKYDGTASVSVKAAKSYSSAGNSVSKTASNKNPSENLKFSEADEIESYLDFIMAGRKKDADYNTLRSQYREQLNEVLSGDKIEAEFKLADGSTVTVYSANASYEEFVDLQSKRLKDFCKKDDIYAPMLPYTHLEGSQKYQFIDISCYKNIISEEEAKNILKGKGVLDGKEKIFIQAAEDYHISPAYLIGHSLLETGGGTSVLARGTIYHGKLVHNVFGFGAYDKRPIYYGSKIAYEEGFWTVNSAIYKGTGKIDELYIEHKQTTIYEMLWNTYEKDGRHYATNVHWAENQAGENQITQIYDNMPRERLHYRIPLFSD